MRLELLLLFGICFISVQSSRLCVYKYDNEHFPSYCSEATELCDSQQQYTIRNITKLSQLFGYQDLVNMSSCESYQTKQTQHSLYCLYKCNEKHYPNLCLSSGEVCPFMDPIHDCPLFHVPLWFNNTIECNNQRNNSWHNLLKEESSVMHMFQNHNLTDEVSEIIFGFQTSNTWDAPTTNTVTLSLIWAGIMYQCIIYPIQIDTYYFCNTSDKYYTRKCDSISNNNLFVLQIDKTGDNGVGIDKVLVKIPAKNISLEVNEFCFNSSNHAIELQSSANNYVADKCLYTGGYDVIFLDSQSPVDSKFLSITLNSTPFHILRQEAYINIMDEPLQCLPKLEDKYILVSEPKTWLDAQHYCETVHNSSLATITSDRDFQIVIALMSKHYDYVQSRFWIGLNDIDKNGYWTWIDGSSCDYAEGGLCKNDIHWLPNEPDNEATIQYCVELYALAGYNDNDCTNLFNFFCNNNNYTSNVNVGNGSGNKPKEQNHKYKFGGILPDNNPDAKAGDVISMSLAYNNSLTKCNFYAWQSYECNVENWGVHRCINSVYQANNSLFEIYIDNNGHDTVYFDEIYFEMYEQLYVIEYFCYENENEASCQDIIGVGLDYNAHILLTMNENFANIGYVTVRKEDVTCVTGAKEYEVIMELLTFDEAKNYPLATVENDADFNQLIDIWHEFGGYKNMWIGLKTDDGTNWSWVDKSKCTNTETPELCTIYWAEHEPSSTVKEFCGGLYSVKNGMLNNFDCDDQFWIICNKNDSIQSSEDPLIIILITVMGTIVVILFAIFLCYRYFRSKRLSTPQYSKTNTADLGEIHELSDEGKTEEIEKGLQIALTKIEEKQVMECANSYSSKIIGCAMVVKMGLSENSVNNSLSTESTDGMPSACGTNSHLGSQDHIKQKASNSD